MVKNGFTMVELLAVIVIISLLLIISIPAINAVSGRIKDNLMTQKIELAEKAALMWAQDNRQLFVASAFGGTSWSTTNCPAPMYNSPTTSTNGACLNHTGSSERRVRLRLHQLVTAGYYEYDKGRVIEDPRDSSTCMNNYVVTIAYNTRTRTFSAQICDNGTGNNSHRLPTTIANGADTCSELTNFTAPQNFTGSTKCS